MDADGNARTAVQLTNGQLDGPSGIAPLPDGRVGYVSRVGEDLTLWVMNPDGSDQHQIGLAMPLVEELRATPDGRFFIFSARRDGFSHLYRIDTNGRDLRQLTVGESDEISSTISPDSKSVYYFAGVRDRERRKTYLRKISIDGGETVNLKEMDNDLVPELSPDGKLIASLVGSLTRGVARNGRQTASLSFIWYLAEIPRIFGCKPLADRPHVSSLHSLKVTFTNMPSPVMAKNFMSPTAIRFATLS
jgi:WD40 repeat protein